MKDFTTSFAYFPSTRTISIRSSASPLWKSEKFSRASQLRCVSDSMRTSQSTSQVLLLTTVIGLLCAKILPSALYLIFERLLTATRFLSLGSKLRSTPNRSSRWLFESFRDYQFTD